MAIQPGCEHIGEEYAAQSDIGRCAEAGNCLEHGQPLKRLASAEQFAVDLADRLHDLAGSVIVGEELRRLLVKLLREVIHLWTQPWVADREIVLGAMAGALGAFASRLAAPFEALDEGATEDRLEWGQLPQESVALLSQARRGLFAVFHRTTYITGLIVYSLNTYFNLFVLGWTGLAVGWPTARAIPHRIVVAGERASPTVKDRPSLSIRAEH